MSSGSSARNLSAADIRRFRRPSLRQATLILPSTGERIRKTFTLREPSVRQNGSYHDATRQLLPWRSASSRRRTFFQASRSFADRTVSVGYSTLTSTLGQDILKCSIAYLLGSLATLVPFIAATLGHQDGKHMVATVTVYFHPARSAGSMSEAFVLALIAVAYAAVVSFSSMAVSVFFGSRNLLAVGHALVLVVFCGAGLGFVGWLKQKMGNPLVNVACSLTSLVIISVLTREGAVQAAKFSYDKIFQVLKMVLMGMAATVAVNFLIKPRSARRELREDLVKITDMLEELLTTTARGFLFGSDEDLNGESYAVLSYKYRSIFKSLVKNLREAKFEHYILGTEILFHIESRLVKCIERLGQSLVGLRSAASTEFDLISKSTTGSSNPMRRLESVSSSFFASEPTAASSEGLASIVEEPEQAEAIEQGIQERLVLSPDPDSPPVNQPADIFALFISQLGPPMKSLTYTLKEILNDLQFGPGPSFLIMANSNFRSSLVQAIELYTHSRKQSLDLLYRSKAMATSGSKEVTADYEEVASSCGYFSSCLQDFAEDTIEYLDILDELKTELDRMPRRRSWTWLSFWRKRATGTEVTQFEEVVRTEDIERHLPPPLPLKQDSQLFSTSSSRHSFRIEQIRVLIWRSLSFLRREDVKFAVKVGLGAILYAMVSFIPATRPIYQHWRGEWGLLSYMLVCSMTIGASNTTGLQRFIGTCLGALLAIAAWMTSNGNPFILGFLGWLTSVCCFYIILAFGKGPMGRFILLTYNLSALYAYSLSSRDFEDDDDEGGVNPAIWEIVLHRVVAVMTGCLWGMIVTRVIWPISAGKKLKDGLSLLWLRMGLIWKRDPLSTLLEGDTGSSYMDIRESVKLQRFLTRLETLRESATHEFDLRGPFPDEVFRKILDGTGRMLGSFTAMNTVILKDLKASPGEAEVLRHTRDERAQLSARISHLFTVLASSMKLEYPMNDTLPNLEHTRDRLLAKVFDFRQQHGNDTVSDEDFELIYAYALVTGQIAKEIEMAGSYVEQLYGVLNEDSLQLR